MVTVRQATRTALGVALAGLAACSLSRLARTSGQVDLQDEIVAIGFDTSQRALEFQLREAGGSVPVLRLFGVTLVLEEAGRPKTRRASFTSIERRGSRIVAACERILDHELAVECGLVAPGRCYVETTDKVGARSLIREIRLDYEVLTERLDETFAPGQQPTEASAIADSAFRVPLLFLRSGRRAIQLLPDLELLQNERPLPQALELDARVSPFRISHGFVATRFVPAERGNQPDSFLRDGAAPALVRGKTLSFGHTLTFDPRATPGASLGAAIASLWGKASPERGAPSLALVAETAQTNLVRRLSPADTKAPAGASAVLAGLVEPARATPLLAPESGLALAARALADRAAEGDTQRCGELAAAICEVALSAPRRTGLFPPYCELAGDGSLLRWRFAEGPSERYHAFDIALVYRELGRAADALAQRDSTAPVAERVRASIADGIRFLRSNQVQSGAVPAWYESRYLVPEKGSRETISETSAVALLFAEAGTRTTDPAAIAAAQRALACVEANALRNQDWPDAATAGLPPDLRGGQAVRRALPIACAALTAVALHKATRNPGLIARCDALLEELAPLQAVWTPPWSGGGSRGEISVGNDMLASAPAVQALAIEAFFSGYRTTGRRQHLERAVAGLRWLASRAAETEFGASFALDVARLASARLALREFGQVVVDLDKGFAEAIDAVEIEDFRIEPQSLAMSIVSRSPGMRRALVTFVQATPSTSPLSVTVGRSTPLTLTPSQLASGTELPVQELPDLRFRPPTELAVDTLWYPRADVKGALPEDARLRVEIRVAGAQTAFVGLEPLPLPGQYVAREPFDPRGLEVGTRLEARLLVESANSNLAEPRLGTVVITMADAVCVDPGDDDEKDLQSAGGSSVQRFGDGRENARVVAGTASFTYRLDVPREATQLRVLMRLSGLADITSGMVELHRDTLDGERDLRDEEIVFADRRLWARGSIALTFRCADPADAQGLALAKLRYRPEGNAVAAPAAESIGARSGYRRVDPRIVIGVLPVALADRPLGVDAEQLRQAFFGGPEYRMTPPPESRRTAGSVAELVNAMSGARTLIDGIVLPQRMSSVLAQELLSATDPRRELAKAIEGLPPSGENPLDVLVVVLGGSAIRPELDGSFVLVRDCYPEARGRLATLPIVFLAERGSDGSLFSSAHALAGLIEARYGLPNLALPDLGNFGELALSSSRALHLSSGMVGINLARLGWCDQLTLPFESLSDLPIAPLYDGRTLYELPIPLPGRGSLLVESRAGSRAEPGLSDGGLLIYWQLTGTTLRIHRASGDHSSPLLLRLSPELPRFATPFTPCRAAQDLFRANCDLDEASNPSLSTLTGEGMWRLHRRKLATGDKLAVEFLGLDLFKVARVGILRDGSIPLPSEASPVPGSASVANAKIVLFGSSTPGSRIGAIFDVGSTRLPPCRLVGRLVTDSTRADSTFSVRLKNRELRCELGEARPDAFWWELDLDGVDAQDQIEMQLLCRQGTGVRAELDQIWIVPRAPTLSTITADASALASARLVDGNVYGHAFRIVENSVGQPKFRVPALWPMGQSWLRVRLAHSYAATADADSQLDVAILARDGSRSHALVSNLHLQRRGEDKTVTILLLEIPPADIERVALLEFAVRGSPLHVVSCEILRE